MTIGNTTRNLAYAGAIVLITTLAFGGSLDGEFVSDDLRAVRDNPLLESLDWTHVREIFTSFDDANYMPLKVLSLALDRAVWGPEPFGFHLVNLAFHIGCALLVFWILLDLGFSSFAAFAVALLWAVHPLQVESVAWISERKNVLSGLFFFGSFRTYLEFSRSPRRTTYAVTLALFVLALLSKMNTVVLPAICIAYEVSYNRRVRRLDLLAVAPMVVLGILAVWYNLAGSAVHGSSFHGGSATVTWLSSTVVVFRYLWHVVWPVDLAPGYDVVLRGSLFDASVFFSLLGLLGIALAIALLLRHKRREAFWILWAAITLAPMLNVVPFRSMMQDRYMYLALLGPLALVGMAFDSVSESIPRRVSGAAIVAAAALFSHLTIGQVEVWSNGFALWARTATTRPMDAAGGLGSTTQANKIAHLEAALRNDPTNATLHNNLGNLNYRAGLKEEALERYEEANRLRPDEPHNLVNLGRVYLEFSRFEEAERVLVRATELRPNSYSAWRQLLRLQIAVRDVEEARRAWEACVRIRPDAASSDSLRVERGALQRLAR